LAAKRYKYAVK
jgi:aspartate-semialdehyde dehydrogenase